MNMNYDCIWLYYCVLLAYPSLFHLRNCYSVWPTHHGRATPLTKWSSNRGPNATNRTPNEGKTGMGTGTTIAQPLNRTCSIHLTTTHISYICENKKQNYPKPHWNGEELLLFYPFLGPKIPLYHPTRRDPKVWRNLEVWYVPFCSWAIANHFVIGDWNLEIPNHFVG